MFEDDRPEDAPILVPVFAPDPDAPAGTLPLGDMVSERLRDRAAGIEAPALASVAGWPISGASSPARRTEPAPGTRTVSASMSRAMRSAQSRHWKVRDNSRFMQSESRHR